MPGSSGHPRAVNRVVVGRGEKRIISVFCFVFLFCACVGSAGEVCRFGPWSVVVAEAEEREELEAVWEEGGEGERTAAI